MFYYTYKITNLINDKIYIGVHKTTELDDGYMGSGTVIRNAIQKHGIQNFKKDILKFFECSELMYEHEKEIVTDEFLLREDTYNLRRGGSGGFDYINKVKLNDRTGMIHSALSKEKMSVSCKASFTEDRKQEISKRTKLLKPALGVKHKTPPNKSIDHKNKISESLSNVKHQLVECPHCLIAGGERALKRWHFDNCKALRA